MLVGYVRVECISNKRGNGKWSVEALAAEWLRNSLAIAQEWLHVSLSWKFMDFNLGKSLQMHSTGFP